MKRFLYLFSIVLITLFFYGCGNIINNNENSVIPERESPSTTASNKEVFVNIDDQFVLPVLLFHHIGNPSSDVNENNKIWYVSEDKFEDILEYIKKIGYNDLFTEEAVEYINRGVLPEKAIIISFDDGAKDFYDKAWPILRKYKIKSSVYLMTGVKGDNWLSKDQIKELSDSGLVEFGSHTRYHEYLTRVDMQTARAELGDSKKYLDDLLDKEIKIISYPFGLYNQDIIEMAKGLGYRAGLTIKSGSWQSKENLFEIRRNIITNNTNIENLFKDL
ncbi:MAG: polysaccharide deacetylase family protein [Candidatus Magasanikbacteria bacterium]|nr:polysaccharide deacetylase family protein [Candidatus Magasanikbacteria bacterium]